MKPPYENMTVEELEELDLFLDELNTQQRLEEVDYAGLELRCLLGLDRTQEELS